MAEITEELLAGIVSREVDDAESWAAGELADQQAENLRYYFGEKLGNEIDGFSQVVTRDVLEAVEGIMPELMKIFASSDSVVEFEPQGPEDVQAAEQATDYLNYIFHRRLGGFNILYNWFKDALLMKNGIIKVGWEEKDRVEMYTFTNLTEDEIEEIEIEDGVEILEEKELDGGLFEVKVSRTIKKGQPFIEPIPSEEFRIKQRAKSLKETDFVAHVTEKTVGELLECGYKREDVEYATTVDRLDDNQVEDARFSDTKEGTNAAQPVGNDGVVEVIEAYVRMYDDDGERIKLFKVVQVGDKVLEWEEVNTIPFISLSPIMMPHKFTGIGIPDLVKDIQMIRSQLYRNTLDNLALTNAGRYEAVEGLVNLQDLMDNKIGGIVRVKQLGSVQQLPTPQLGQATFPFLQELEQEKEDRVGVSKMTQGLDPNALTSNTAATAVNQIMTAAQQKILLIARVFAETGVKDLFLHLYGLVRTHQTEADIVRLRGTFVPVNPFDWQDRYDMTVTVGIGNGNKDQQLFHLNNIRQMMQEVSNSPFGYLITAENVYNTATEVVKNAGYKNVNSFIANPAQVEPPPPQPSPEMIAAQAEAAKDQADAALKQQQLQLDQMKLQLEQAKFDWQKRIEAAELGIEATQGRPVGIGDGK